MKKLLHCLLALLPTALAAGPVTLVRDGVPASEIVVAEKASRSAQFAALELQHHVRLISGATLPIVNDKAPSSPDKIRVLVGPSAAAESLGVRAADFKGEEYMVKFAPGSIILAGNDTPDHGKVDYQNMATFPNFAYHEKSTLWAVYDFLEKCCGVRWYAPTDVGITFKESKTLAVEPVSIRRKPAMDAQRYFYAPKFHYEYEKPFPDRDNAILKLRWRQTLRFGATNHNVYSVWFKYWGKSCKPGFGEQFVEKRPEYFARNYPGNSSMYLLGTRTHYPDDKDLPPQVCLSNPDVIRHFAEEAVNGHNGKWDPGVMRAGKLPDTPWFYSIVEDDNHGVCGCENCSKLFADRPAAEKTSMLHFDWVNKIAREAGRMNPNVGITTLSYGTAIYYPKGLELEPNVSIMMTMGVSNWWHPVVRKRHHDIILKEWVEQAAKKKNILQMWTYFLSPGWDAKIVFKYQDFFPCFGASKIGPIFKDFVAQGIRGWFGESNDELGYPLWSNQLDAYVASRICDDPGLDTKKLMDEFFPAYYGSAGEPMKKFYHLVENAVWDTNNYPKEWFKDENKIGPFGKMDYSAYCGFYTEEVCWGMLGTKERMAELAKCVDEARKLVKTDAEKKRLDWFEKGTWEPMLRGRAKYEEQEKYRKHPAPELVVARVKSAGGDPMKVDWDAAANTGAWRTVNAIPDNPSRHMRLAYDDKFLYLKFFEKKDSVEYVVDPNNFWLGDTLEIFFSADKQRPYVQLGVNPEGKSELYAYRNENGVDFSGKWPINHKIANQFDGASWTVCVALPLKEFGLGVEVGPESVLYANFFRNSPKRMALAWSPTFSRFFPELPKMGKLVFAAK